MKYCHKCNIAGDIDYEWNGIVGCFNCGGPLQEADNEWLKSEKVEMVVEVPDKRMEEDPYP